MTQNIKYLFSATHCDGVTDENMVENGKWMGAAECSTRPRTARRYRSERPGDRGAVLGSGCGRGSCRRFGPRALTSETSTDFTGTS